MIVMLYDYSTGELLSCMEGGRLGQIRTGAASGWPPATWPGLTLIR